MEYQQHRAFPPVGNPGELSRESSGKESSFPSFPAFPTGGPPAGARSAAPACACEGRRLVVRRIRSGSREHTTYCEQCPRCGASSMSIAASKLGYGARSLAPAFDETLRRRWWDRVAAYHEAQAAERDRAVEEGRAREQREWQDRYDRHVTRRSPRWRALCSLVMQRCRNTCEGCGIAPATQVHHATYQHLGDEFLWELRGLCRDCHRRFHGIEEDDA